MLAYTSGTTGHPKGAMLAQRTVLSTCRLNTISYRLPAYSVAAITGTLSFPAMMPAHALSRLYVGGTAVIMGRWDSEILVDTIEREQVTFTSLATPTMRGFAEYAREVPRRWRSMQSVLHFELARESAIVPPPARATSEIPDERVLSTRTVDWHVGNSSATTTWCSSPTGASWIETQGRRGHHRPRPPATG